MKPPISKRWLLNNAASPQPIDELSDHCENIAVLAGLLEHCGSVSSAELPSRLVAGAGRMIAAEISCLQRLIDPRLAKLRRCD